MHFFASPFLLKMIIFLNCGKHFFQKRVRKKLTKNVLKFDVEKGGGIIFEKKNV